MYQNVINIILLLISEGILKEKREGGRGTKNWYGKWLTITLLKLFKIEHLNNFKIWI